MIRVVLFLVFVACVAVGAAWLADRPGDVTIIWLDQRIETSVMVAAAAIAAGRGVRGAVLVDRARRAALAAPAGARLARAPPHHARTGRSRAA